MPSSTAPSERDVARFWARVDSATDDECWPWQAYVMKNGYGRFQAAGEQLAHRFAYIAFVGPIPDGLVIDHLCRNRSCVNLAHLEAVTMGENSRRGLRGVLRDRMWRDEARAMREQGLSYLAIARRMGRSPKGVWNALNPDRGSGSWDSSWEVA